MKQDKNIITNQYAIKYIILNLLPHNLEKVKEN